MPLQEPIAITSYEKNRFLAYPHSNGFADGGGSLVVGEFDGLGYSLVRIDLATGRDTLRFPFPIKRLSHSLPTFEIARETNILFFVVDSALWMIHLDEHNEPELVYRSQKQLCDIVSASADGSRVAGFATTGDSYCAVQIDVASGNAETLFTHPWWVGHVHYCPFDESIIGYCHEGKAEETSDRVWLHSKSGGRCLFDQRWDDLSTRLSVGHERWAFHDASVVLVAYGVSTGTPRGVYEAFADDRTSRLISKGDRDFHLDISRDGRWIVVDTTGPYDLPGKGWDNAGIASDILLIDRSSGARELLVRSTEHHTTSHAHPVFSPDGRWIFYHQTNDAISNWRVMKVKNPWVD